MKKYFRWLSVIFLTILLAGCGSSDSDLPKASSALKQEIEAAWLWDTSNFVWYDESDASTWAEGVRYYGTYGNAAALYRGGSGEYGGIDNGLVFYSNGKIYSPDAAIVSAKREEGVMTMEDLQNVATFHKEFSSTTEKRGSVFVYEGIEGVTVLPSELQKEVEAAWWEEENCELSWTRKRNDIRYYGNYDGTVVIYTDFSALTNWYEIEIGGVKIGGGNFNLYAYREGEIAHATEAYEKGWLTKENIETIADYHKLCEAKSKQ